MLPIRSPSDSLRWRRFAFLMINGSVGANGPDEAKIHFYIKQMLDSTVSYSSPFF
jgi:hypothetical protein